MPTPLANPPADLIAGTPVPLDPAGPGEIVSTNPADPSREIWRGVPKPAHVDAAVAAARDALPAWSRTSLEERARVLHRVRDIFKARVDDFARLISEETGKALWDAKGEAGILAGKIDITLSTAANAGMSRVTGFESAVNDTKRATCRFMPHGVMAVIGPFNFPAHLPNGHIIPALAMGNTVVLKPSDKTPAVGQFLGEIYAEALAAEGAPPGTLSVVQGAADVAQRLTTHADIDGILFTGSWPVGRRILEANLDHPGRVVALEMGGNNPAVIMPDADLRQAAIECVRCAFITTGQRCTCTRRVIVHEALADRVIAAICKSASTLIVGPPDAEHPVFMGPLVTAQARDAVLAAQAKYAKADATVLVEATIPDHLAAGHYVTPSVIQVDRFDRDADDAGCDEETFGPLLRISIARDLDDAIHQANATRFGLASSIFSKDQATIDRYVAEARAGCVNVNTGTAGASSALPFGGLGLSGNHRPAGAFSLDYCAYPVAGMIESGDAAAIPAGMTFDDNWVS